MRHKEGIRSNVGKGQMTTNHHTMKYAHHNGE